MAGTPRECARRLREYVGVDETLLVNVGGMRYEAGAADRGALLSSYDSLLEPAAA